MSRRDAFLDHLAEVPLFSALSRKELALVARRAEDVKVDEGRILVSEGSTGSEFFVIIDGQAAVSRKGRKLATLNPGTPSGSSRSSTRRPATPRSRPPRRWRSSSSASASSAG
jgi:CRP-like cAMP-binding protein